MKTWQESMLDELNLYFEPREDVLGLILFGSLSHPESHPDDWSDIDVLVVVKDGTVDNFFPTVEWMADFGRLYTYSQSGDEFRYTTRACFEDLNRIDFVITTEGNLAKINRWSSIPISSSIRVIFSRSVIVDRVARHGQFPHPFTPATDERFQELVRNFRFKSTQAVHKVVRNDLLIALHLSQDLIRDCCVLGMMLRDRAAGTNIHRHGGAGNQLVAQLEKARKPFTPGGILDGIQESNEIFDRLAGEWSDEYQEGRQPLSRWIGKARAELCKYERGHFPGGG